MISSCACSFQYEGLLVGASGGAKGVFVCPWHDSPILRVGHANRLALVANKGVLPTSLQIVQEATTWPDSTCMAMDDKLSRFHALQSDKRSHVLGVGSWGWSHQKGHATCKCSPPLTGPRPTLKSFSFARAPITQRSDIARVSPPNRRRLNAYLDTLPIALFQGSPSARPTLA